MHAYMYRFSILYTRDLTAEFTTCLCKQRQGLPTKHFVTLKKTK